MTTKNYFLLVLIMWTSLLDYIEKVKSFGKIISIFKDQLWRIQMPKFLTKWKVNPKMMPTSPEECMELLQSMNERIKALLDSGMIVDWGEYWDGSGGYAISEGDDVANLYASLMQWWPYVGFDAKPVLTIDQVIKSTNKAAAGMKGK
jgi:hypothetical protein